MFHITNMRYIHFRFLLANNSSCSCICCVSSTYSFNPRTFAERNAEAIDVSRDQTKRQEKVLSITYWGQSLFEIPFKYFTITVSTSLNFGCKKVSKISGENIGTASKVGWKVQYSNGQ